MKQSEWLKMASARLEKAGVPDAALDAQLLLSHHTGKDRLMLLMMAGQTEITPEDEQKLENLLSRRELREPLQYIVGEAWFMGRAFKVDPRVLIPRSDTEILCEQALLRIREGMEILDIGTGSGALAVSMALENPRAHVSAADISPDALAVAQMNARLLGAQVAFYESDLFSALEGKMWDGIVSNPPYIPSGDLAGLQSEVQREPSLALDGGADGLDIYRCILLSLPGRLRPGGFLLLEAGDGEAEILCRMCREQFEEVNCLPDWAGLSRVVMADGFGRKHAG